MSGGWPLLSPSTLDTTGWPHIGWRLVNSVLFTICPPQRRASRLSRDGSEVRRLVHLTHQVYTSLIYYWPSGTSSSLCLRVASGDSSWSTPCTIKECTLVKWGWVSRPLHLFPTSTSWVKVGVKFFNLHTLAKWGSGFSISLPRHSHIKLIFMRVGFS